MQRSNLQMEKYQVAQYQRTYEFPASSKMQRPSCTGTSGSLYPIKTSRHHAVEPVWSKIRVLTTP